MRVASSMQSIWDPRLIVPPNSSIMGDGCLNFPEFPLIDLDELDLRFIERPTSPTIIHPTSSKINLRRRLLRPFILRRCQGKHLEARQCSESHLLQLQIFCHLRTPLGCVSKKPFTICSTSELTLLVHSLFTVAGGPAVDTPHTSRVIRPTGPTDCCRLCFPIRPVPHRFCVLFLR